jgi:hypothetical protein
MLNIYNVMHLTPVAILSAIFYLNMYMFTYMYEYKADASIV